MAVDAAERLEQDATHDAAEALQKEQESHKPTVIDAVASVCQDTSPFADLREIEAALKAGGKLTAKALSGGKTNISYKVFLEGDPENAVFAKVCFSYALWNPDRSVLYDLKRTENEFQLMSDFAKMAGPRAPIAAPYHLVNASDTINVVITQWSLADEQWANQFIDGEYDKRIIPQVAEAFATLNCAPFEPDFNRQILSCMDTMWPVYKMLFDEYVEAPNPDRCVEAMKNLGTEELHRLIDLVADRYNNKQECLTHNDGHCFNILVEKKPSVDKLKQFGDKGMVTICDWEMAYVSESGKDVGIIQFWPIACMLCHAAQGRKDIAYDILEFFDLYWQSYASAMVKKGGKDEEYLRGAFRSAISCAAMYTFGIVYILKFFQDLLPLEGMSEDDRAKAIGSIGYVGLQFMQYGTGTVEPDLSLDELKIRHQEILVKEIEECLTIPAGRRMRPRRASVLRTTGRRVSDASLFDEASLEVARRASAVELIVGRRVSVIDPIIADALKEEDE